MTQHMFNLTRRAPSVPASTQAVVLRDVRKVYGRGDGAVVALDGVTADGRTLHARAFRHDGLAAAGPLGAALQSLVDR